jgi:hypothetical protein
MNIAARMPMPVIINANIMNRWGTNAAGLDSPDILTSIYLKNAFFSAIALIDENTKNVPKNSPKAKNRKAPLSWSLKARKVI